MFANKTHGSCTSTAIYQTTVLRALGIPTRMILCIPPADASDPAQVKMLDKGLTHHQVRRDVLLGAIGGRQQLQQSHVLRSICGRDAGGGSTTRRWDKTCSLKTTSG